MFETPGPYRMAKRKSKTAMSGISRFVSAMNTQHTQSNTADQIQNCTVEDGEPPAKRHHTENDTSGIDRDHQWLKKYEATGLIRQYTSLDQVPEHLQKCIRIITFNKWRQPYFSYRFLATISVFFFVFDPSWMSSG